MNIGHHHGGRGAHGARRGFAVMLVLGAMVFLAAAIVGIAVLFAHEARRTRAAVAEAQLRQGLLAARALAQGELAQRGTVLRDVPVALPADGAVMQLHVAGDAQTARVRVAATLHGFRASQEMVFTRGPDRAWQLRETRLDQTAQQ